MGAFKIQTDLDLSGFNLLNFCIQSYTDLANVPNLGLGRKLFFTGNSTDKKNLREVIWDGDKWKAAVYLDDIEALTNGEGSLGTRVKALEDMLGLEDVTDVIDTWNDVKAFFANVDEGLDLMTMLDGKLDKTGGTITGDITVKGLSSFNKRLSMREGAILDFYKADGNLIGVLGPYSGNNYELSWYDGSAWNILIHSGNIGSYKAGDSAKLNRKEARYYMDSFMLSTGTDLNTNLVSEARPYIATLYDSNHPNQPDSKLANGNILHIASPSAQTAWELIAGFSSSSPLMFRCGTWKADGTGSINTRDWKTIAFTDSTVEAANRLANKVSLWGNEFDGTKSLSGAIKIRNNSSLFFRNAEDTEDVSAIMLSNTNRLAFGVGARTSGYITQVFGKAIDFYTGSSGISMTITEEGRVLIKRQANNLDAIIGTKGLVHIEGGSTKTALGSAPANGLTIGYDTIGGLAQWIHETNFSGNVQAMNLAGTATAYALNLNPLGGAVNVGSLDSTTNVLGSLSIADKVSISKNAINSRVAYLGTTGGANYIWGYDSINYLVIGAGSTALSRAKGSMVVYSDKVEPGTNNAVLLGSASYRWSDVYSVGGNFSGRVLIGGATDDENYVLNVKGGVRFYDSSVVDYLIKGGDTIVKLQDTYASSFRFVYGLQIGQEQKAAFGFAGTVSNPFAFIGQNSTRWFSINSEASNFNVLTNFNAGALIPTGQTLTIGSVTFRETAAGEVEVDGNLHTTGTLASGGKAAVGEGDNGGGGNANVYSDVLEGVITQEWEVGNPFQKEDVIVSLYMWNTDESRWEMVLADIGVTSENIWVTFGRPTSTTDKYMAVVMG